MSLLQQVQQETLLQSSTGKQQNERILPELGNLSSTHEQDRESTHPGVAPRVQIELQYEESHEQCP